MKHRGPTDSQMLFIETLNKSAHIALLMIYDPSTGDAEHFGY